MIRKGFLMTLGSMILIALLLLAFVVPYERKSGIIDTTLGMCNDWPKSVKRYHLLLSQREDFNLVAKHLVPIYANTPCGQEGDFRLYLL